MNTYVKGNIIRVAGLFTDDSGAVLDPTVIKCLVLAPGAVLPTVYQYGVDAEMARDSAGRYHADIDADTEGVWRYRWQSTGNGQAANESAFEIAVSPF